MATLNAGSRLGRSLGVLGRSLGVLGRGLGVPGAQSARAGCESGRSLHSLGAVGDSLVLSCTSFQPSVKNDTSVDYEEAQPHQRRWSVSKESDASQNDHQIVHNVHKRKDKC